MSNIIYVKNPEYKDVEILANGLADHAKQVRGQSPAEEFVFFALDDGGNKIGGCYGVLYYGCLCIYKLWIAPEFRSQGLGQTLVQQAEKFGNENGCLFYSVSTMDWEALDFYKKIGYYVEFERHGYLKDSILYELRKDC